MPWRSSLPALAIIKSTTIFNMPSFRVSCMLTSQLARGDSPSLTIDAELEKHLRDNIRITEEIQNLIESDSGNDLLKSLEILAALRDAHEPDPTSRAGSVGKSQRERTTKRKHTETIEDRDSIAAESPGPGGPSPKVSISTSASRLIGKVASRASSVPIAREASVKAEDGGESADSLKSKARL